MTLKRFYHVNDPETHYELFDRVKGAGNLKSDEILCYRNVKTGQKFGRTKAEWGSRMRPVPEGRLMQSEMGERTYQEMRDLFLRGLPYLLLLSSGYREESMIWLFGPDHGPKNQVAMLKTGQGVVVLPDVRLLTTDRVLVSMTRNLDNWNFVPAQSFIEDLGTEQVGDRVVRDVFNAIYPQAFATRLTPLPDGGHLLHVAPLIMVGRHHVVITYRIDSK